MKKVILGLIAATSLSACMGTEQTVGVTQGAAFSMSCASVHMQTANGLPMRCGPQTVAPYTLR